MKREHYKILITDPLLKEMVNQASKRFPEYASKIEWMVAEKGDEQELVAKAPGVDILVGARNRITKNVF